MYRAFHRNLSYKSILLLIVLHVHRSRGVTVNKANFVQLKSLCYTPANILATINVYTSRAETDKDRKSMMELKFILMRQFTPL